jgi:type IV secretion system protein VirB1
MKIYSLIFLISLLFLPHPAFAGFWRECSVYANPVTMEKIVYVESNGNPYAIDDDTMGRSYYYSDKYSAVSAARHLVDAGHNVDLGLAQINISNIRSYGLSISDAFNPCYSVFYGSYILLQGYNLALRRFKNVRVALFRALEYYNSGQFFGDRIYAEKVWEALN